MSDPSKFPSISFDDWRAQVEKELAGKSFEKSLVSETSEGLRIAPLYTTSVVGPPSEARLVPFRVCMRADAETLAEELRDGADAAWLSSAAIPKGGDLSKTFFVIDDAEAIDVTKLPKMAGFALDIDPLARRASGQASFSSIDEALAGLGKTESDATTVMVSTLPYHDAGADAADEIAIALSTGVLYLRALIAGGRTAESAARAIALRISLGRDTFLELAKVRALRRCWRKLLGASGAPGAPAALIHGVCSSRTLTVRDPWVNMLRVTTQVFAGVLGGADLLTPNAFDDAFGTKGSAHGRRVARNTGLVLREESALGRVVDPAGGAYFFETLTDDLARRAWEVFRGLERDGGVRVLLESGELAERLEAKWVDRLAQIARRKISILGTSDFAALDEKLPHAPPGAAPRRAGLPIHRDAEAFEALRTRNEDAPEAILVVLGPLAESRARAGFASSFFGAGGVRTRETTNDEKAKIACICGTDERYTTDAVARAKALKAAGCEKVVLAGRPGALEADLRAAGVDAFIFVGCDVVATLTELA